ncbi:hypothetical protein B0J18DRAFT_375665 [Chaetomium sp. MPI-SDFR-AT-0129]|nr:hypothetical protein B0J18DRAFT_375665 [Chaetomium sp. MPI-SDFR-AT-0129]
MSSRRAAALAPSRATAFRNPWCGAEIEIFVKLKPSVQGIIQQKLRRNPRSMAGHWRDWDFDLENGTGNLDRKEKQRRCVGKAILEILDQTLGPNHRWSCESDASLKEYTLTHPPDTRKWWGIEIISPPFPADSEWNVTFNQVFDAINRTFDLWTNDLTSCHVHVSPGPYKDSKYTMDQLAQVAKGAFFFEGALMGLLPAERRMNRYALPNWSIYSPQQYYSVALQGWAPLFDRISRHAYQHGNDTNAFARRMTTMESSGETTRYASTSFDPFARLGTVEFRRQAGVASAKTAIRRVLLALTLHITALTMNFDNASRDVGRAHPTTENLIGTLFTTLKTYLPERAYKDAAFKTWLQQCARDYANDSDGEDQFGRMVRRFDEVEINKREANMRAYGVYVVSSYLADADITDSHRGLPLRSRDSGPIYIGRVSHLIAHITNNQPTAGYRNALSTRLVHV